MSALPLGDVRSHIESHLIAIKPFPLYHSFVVFLKGYFPGLPCNGFEVRT